MSWAFRTGSVLGALGVLSVIGVLESGGFGPCMGSIWGLMFLLAAVGCVPMAGLFLAIGIFIELRPKRTAATFNR